MATAPHHITFEAWTYPWCDPAVFIAMRGLLQAKVQDGRHLARSEMAQRVTSLDIMV